MDNIVNLRAFGKRLINGSLDRRGIEAAAAEIDRLRAENAKLRAMLEKIALWDCFTCSPHARHALTEKE